MFIEIDDSLKIKNVDLFIAKPNKQVIGSVSEAYNINLNMRIGELSSLSFELPYLIEKDHTIHKNKNLDVIKDRYFIKMVYDKKVEWFRITRSTKQANEDGDVLAVEALSLGIELGDKLVRNIDEVSKDLNYMVDLILSDTLWKKGIIDNDLLGVFRAFDVHEDTCLNFLYHVAETFKAIVVWDTANKTINFRSQDSIKQNKGLKISYGKYLKTMSRESKGDEMVTRLIPRGHDGLTIRGISVNGADYIDNFNFFMYPFERDSDRKIMSESYWMTNGLCHALMDYNVLLENNKDEFNNLLSTREEIQSNLLDKNAELVTLKSQLAQIEDSIDIEKSNDRDFSSLENERFQILNEIESKIQEIESIDINLDENSSNLTALQMLLSANNTDNFTPEELLELNSFIIERTWSNENIVSDSDLLKEAEKAFEDMRKPQTVFSVDIIDFTQILEGQKDWGKLNIGDVVYIEHEYHNERVEAMLIGIDMNFEEQSVSLTIANIVDIMSDEDWVMNQLYKSHSVSATIDLNKYKWNETGETVSEIGKIIEGTWDATQRRIVAGVSESVTMDGRGLKIVNPEFPNEVLIGQAGVIAASDDGGITWKHALTSSGIVGENIYGKLLAGEHLIIDASNTNGSSIFRVDGSGVTIDGTSLTITNTDFIEANKDYANGIRIDTVEGVVATRSDGKVKTKLNATSGISIEKNNGTISKPSWEKMMYADINGNLVANNLYTRKISIRDNNDNVIIDANSGTIDFSRFPNKIGVIPSGNLDVKGLTVSNGSKTTFRVDMNGDVTVGGHLDGATGTFSGDLAAAGGVFSGEIVGGSIKSDTSIDVTTDLYVGNSIFLGKELEHDMKSIYFNNSTYISSDDMHLDVYAGSFNVFTPNSSFNIYSHEGYLNINDFFFYGNVWFEGNHNIVAKFG